MRTLLTWLLLALAATAAIAQDRLPFVDAFGVVGAELRRSAVVQELGPPPVETEGRQLAYPARGLAFDLVPDSGRDPRVGRMVVSEPSRAATPGGLHVGLDRQAASRLVEIDYRREPALGTPDPQRWLLAERDGGPNARRVEVALDGDRVSRITFYPQGLRAESAPPARPDRPRHPPAIVALVLVLAAIAMLLPGWRRAWGWMLPEAWRTPLGLLALVPGLLALGAGWSALREPDPYGRLAGLMVGLAGIGAVLVGLMLLASAPSRAVAWPARALLLLFVAAAFAEKLGWFG